MKFITIVTLMGVFSLSGFIQARAELIELKGSIKCSTSQQGLSNTFIRVGEYFTYSNDEGDFVLKVPGEIEGKLEVFRLGYANYYCEVLDCSGNRNQYEIYLKKADPKPVSKGNGEEIMIEVFQRMHINYELEDQLMVAYCKESLSAKDAVYHFAEGIVEFHVPSNVAKGPMLLRPLKTRIQTNQFHDGLYEMSGMSTEMIRSWAFSNFLSRKDRWNYKYRLAGTEVYRDETVYMIDFTPGDDRGYVKGRMWVDEFTYAIIRIEYQMTGGSMWDAEKWMEEFQHNNHVYYLSRSNFEGRWKEGRNTYVFKSEVVNTRVKADQENEIVFEEFMPVSRFSFADHVPLGTFEDEFWGSHNYIKLTARERDLLR